MSSLADIHSLVFLGQVPYKIAMFMLVTIILESWLYILGSASVNWEACLSESKTTAVNKLFACVVSAGQALFLCPGCRLRLWVNHHGSGGSGRLAGKGSAGWAFSAPLLPWFRPYILG